MEALLIWLEVRGEDRQCGHQLLLDSKETVSQAGAMTRLPTEFDYVLEYRKDQLSSRCTKSKSEFVAMLSHPQSSLLDRIKEGLTHDPTAKNKMEYAKEGKTRRFWLEGDLLCTKGRRLYVPLFGNLRRELLQECHDS